MTMVSILEPEKKEKKKQFGECISLEISKNC